MIARVLILLLLTVGCISGDSSGGTDNKDTVLESGDFVKAEITGRISDTGEVFYTTREDVALNPAIEKIERFIPPEKYELLGFTLGEEQVLPALEAGMIGMKLGDEKNITLTPEEAYGGWSSEYTVSLQRAAVLPKLTDVPLSTVVSITGKEPELNESVPLNYWTARVVNISDFNVTLLHEPENNTVIETEYGPAVVTLNDTHVVTIINPELGTVVATAIGEGIISDINDIDFTVDFNHLLAGKTLVFEVKVEDIIKARKMLEQKIAWSDYEAGIETAKNEKKPAVIFLYLEGCQSCEAMDTLTFSNPQVTELKDKFVWIKADAGANPDIGDKYDTNTYPTTVLLDSAGEVTNVITGYVTSGELTAEMDVLILAD